MPNKAAIPLRISQAAIEPYTFICVSTKVRVLNCYLCRAPVELLKACTGGVSAVTDHHLLATLPLCPSRPSRYVSV